MKGHVFVFGDNIDTDVIAPGGVLHKGINEIKMHSMEAILPDFHTMVEKDDILVAGRNFGCGSSREQAPLVLKEMGITLILAKSFSRIFFRNAISIGLSLAVIKDIPSLENGQEVVYSIERGFLRTAGSDTEYPFAGPTGPLSEIIKSGGLIEFVKGRLKP